MKPRLNSDIMGVERVCRSVELWRKIFAQLGKSEVKSSAIHHYTIIIIVYYANGSRYIT